MKAKSIYAIVIVIGMLITMSSVVFAIPTSMAIVSTTSSPPVNRPSSTMTGILTTDKSSYVVGETISWTATGLTVGSTYSVWIKEPAGIVDSSINTFIASASTMSGTTPCSVNDATYLAIGNMGRWEQYGQINYDVQILASITLSNVVQTTSTLIIYGRILVHVLDSSNHPVSGISVLVQNVVIPIDHHSLTTAVDGSAEFNTLDASATYQVSGTNTNSVTVSFSSSNNYYVSVTLHINLATTTTSTTTSSSSTSTTSTTHPTTTTTTSISTSISGSSTTTTTITKTETETTTTTTSNPPSNVKVDPIIAGLGIAVMAVGSIGFVRVRSPSGKKRHQ